MRRHDAYIGVIRSTGVAFAIGFAWSTFALAEEPTSPPTPSDQSVQERAVPRKEAGPNKLKGATIQGNQKGLGDDAFMNRHMHGLTMSISSSRHDRHAVTS